jgi:hypothetical protein
MGTKRTCRNVRYPVDIEAKADIEDTALSVAREPRSYQQRAASICSHLFLGGACETLFFSGELCVTFDLR